MAARAQQITFSASRNQALISASNIVGGRRMGRIQKTKVFRRSNFLIQQVITLSILIENTRVRAHMKGETSENNLFCYLKLI